MSVNGIHRARSRPNDVIYTPRPLALRAIEMANIQPDETVLDPSKGGGVFYDNLPPCHKSYCEITEGKDFYKWSEGVDVVIGNPPFSKWTPWLDHTLKVCKKRFIYIFGATSLTGNRLKKILDAGFGITSIHICKVAWWMSQSLIVVAEKGKPSIMTGSPIQNCDICGVNCKRGVFGNPPNECMKKD
jgi:hypothetical protein